MKSPIAPGSHIKQLISHAIAVAVLSVPMSAQQRHAPAPARPAPTFDTLLAADSYGVYGEVRNVGQLLTTGGAGEIVDPIFKLAEPPKEFQSIIKFLKSNSEALATSRLLFATSPARSDLPATLVVLEFTSAEDADKFAPKLEKFLPQILPPVPDATPEASPPNPEKAKPAQPAKQNESEGRSIETATPAPAPNAVPEPTEIAAQPKIVNERRLEAKVISTPSPTQPPAEHLPFVITHAGNLVCISDKPFKFEKLNPVGSKPLVEDQNFRVAHDRFPSETLFLFFNVALEERQHPRTPPKQITEAEAERMRQEEEAAKLAVEAEMVPPPPVAAVPMEIRVEPGGNDNEGNPVLVGRAVPMATPTKEQQAQTAAFSQIESMFDFVGHGEPQWPEAVGVALNLDNDEYVVRAILIESQTAKRLPLPFVPQLISGPAYTPNGPSILPDDTEVFVSASIDFSQTHDGMRKQAEIAAKNAPKQLPAGAKAEALDAFAEFEKRAGFKIKEELLPVLGNEIALAASLKSLQGIEPFGLVRGPSQKPSPGITDEKQKTSGTYPLLLIAIKDRDAARPLLPRVFDGLGLGQANMIAQSERHGDAELVNYGGVFAYAFVGNFLIISEAATVHHVIEVNENHQTLASNNAFRNFRRWQPRQILGEVYVSPAMMEGYQDEIRKKSASTDEKMRDFLLQLSPTSSAITYALCNEGFGEMHELHLPKNLIIAMVAGTTRAMSAMKEGSPELNEAMAMSFLRMISSAEATYQATEGNGSYGSLEKLAEAGLIQKEMFDKYGYKIDLSVSDDQFQATATPAEYGKTGRRSFFIDQSAVIRGDDHAGAPANAMDRPVEGP
jgi:hypothetical protein